MTFHHSLAVLAATLFASALHAEEAKPVDNTPKLAYGQMLKQGEKLVFSPCRDRSYAMMEDISPDRVVTRALNSVGLDAGKKLYVELMAVSEGGMIKASALNLARTEGRCQQPGGKEESWRAAGNEPGWLLAVGNEVVVIKRPGKPDLRLPFTPLKTEGGVTRLDAVAEGNRLALTFEKQLCHDTMADSVFGWTATVNLNGQTLKGCAWQR
ncbi:MAG: COG3650 family protein [Azonexus sp.]